jgi:hypothetical protein
MKYIFSNCACNTCGITFIKVPFVEYRVLGFCSETCWKHISIKTLTKQAYVIRQTVIAINSQAKLDIDFEQRVGAA